MTTRFPVYPPQRLPRPVQANWTDRGAIVYASGSGGWTVHNDWGMPGTTGRDTPVANPSTVNFVVARISGGRGSGTVEGGIYLVGSLKTIWWIVANGASYEYYRYATSGAVWPPGAYEGTVGSSLDCGEMVGPFIGFWFDRTVSPARVRPMWGFDCYENPVAGQPPLGMTVRSGGAANPALSGGGANDIGTPLYWGIGWANSGVTTIGARYTVTETGQDAFYVDDEDSSNIEGRSLVFGSTLNQRLSFPPDRGGHRHGNR